MDRVKAMVSEIMDTGYRWENDKTVRLGVKVAETQAKSGFHYCSNKTLGMLGRRLTSPGRLKERIEDLRCG